jgi:hypothetical protein
MSEFRMRKSGLKSGLLGVVLVLALGVTPTASARGYLGTAGVDFDAVPWETFCPSVQPIPCSRGATTCPVSHPASMGHGLYREWDGSLLDGDLRCETEARQYRDWTRPMKTSDPWGLCRRAWQAALLFRLNEPERFGEPFNTWRARWFGGAVRGNE